MGISGYEAVVISIFLSPLLLLPQCLRVYLAQMPQLTRSLTVVCGIGAYKFEDPEQKLLAITAGTVFGIISTVNEFWSLSKHPKKLNSYIATFILGLLATSTFKFLFYSNNPIWPIMHKENGGYNPLGIFIGLLAAFFTPVLKREEISSLTSSHKVGGSLVGCNWFWWILFHITSIIIRFRNVGPLDVGGLPNKRADSSNWCVPTHSHIRNRSSRNFESTSKCI